MTNGLIQHITVEESTSIQWVRRKAKLKLQACILGKCTHLPEDQFQNCLELGLTETLHFCYVFVSCVDFKCFTSLQGLYILSEVVGTSFFVRYRIDVSNTVYVHVSLFL